jgi:hypothetical protein
MRLRRRLLLVLELCLKECCVERLVFVFLVMACGVLLVISFPVFFSRNWMVCLEIQKVYCLS